MVYGKSSLVGRQRIVLALLLLAISLAGCTASLTPIHSPTPDQPTATTPITPSTERLRQSQEADVGAAVTISAPSSTPRQTPLRSPTAERVLIISVDGLRPDALSEAVSPHLMALAEAGAYTWQAQTVLPSVTLVGHASMLSGVSPERHGIAWNDYRPTRGTIGVPTVFSIAQAAGLHTAMVFGKTKLLHLAAPGTVDNVVNLAGYSDAGIGQQAATLIAEGFGMMFVHLPGVDGIGHATGWMSPPYLSAVTAADEAIGHMLDALDAAGLAETTAVIVTADHGGKDIRHGRDIPEDRTIPWIIAGSGVNVGHRLTRAVSVMDAAPTALFALGLEVPAAWEGRPVREAFRE